MLVERAGYRRRAGKQEPKLKRIRNRTAQSEQERARKRDGNEYSGDPPPQGDVDKGTEGGEGIPGRKATRGSRGTQAGLMELDGPPVQPWMGHSLATLVCGMVCKPIEEIWSEAVTLLEPLVHDPPHSLRRHWEPHGGEMT